MCMGLPMQVQAVEPGHALCEGRGERRRVRTALVGEVAPGDWLLVFLDNAQERLSEVRAQEIAATLDLLDAVLNGRPSDGDPAFELPSRMDLSQLRAWSAPLAETPTP